MGVVLVAVRPGELGQPEPMATLDAILVDPASVRRGIASELLTQLRGHACTPCAS